MTCDFSAVRIFHFNFQHLDIVMVNVLVLVVQSGKKELIRSRFQFLIQKRLHDLILLSCTSPAVSLASWFKSFLSWMMMLCIPTFTWRLHVFLPSPSSLYPLFSSKWCITVFICFSLDYLHESKVKDLTLLTCYEYSVTSILISIQLFTF